MPETPPVAMPATAAPEADLDASLRGRLVPAPRWIVIVWDDPVNLIPYVIYVLQMLFAFSKVKATELTMQVHRDGKAIVAAGAREDMENNVASLLRYGLWATVGRA